MYGKALYLKKKMTMGIGCYRPITKHNKVLQYHIPLISKRNS